MDLSRIAEKGGEGWGVSRKLLYLHKSFNNLSLFGFSQTTHWKDDFQISPVNKEFSRLGRNIYWI